MELVKLVVLATLATSCYGQSGVSSVDVQPTTASTSIITVTASRAYRNESSYQELYDNGLYVSSQSYRYAHYNVSDLFMVILYKTFYACVIFIVIVYVINY